MKTGGRLLLLTGILFGILILLAIAGVLLDTKTIGKQGTEYALGYYSGILVGMILLIGLDYVLIRYGLHYIRKAKRKKLEEQPLTKTGKQ